jgi:hypothetical protein
MRRGGLQRRSRGWPSSRSSIAGSMAGYSRAKFGPAWEDVDLNRRDTRNDILAARPEAP